MTNKSNLNLAYIPWVMGVVASVAGGLLLAYFSDILFQPQLKYSVTKVTIQLPEDYKVEIAKIRANLMLKSFEKAASELKGAETRAEIKGKLEINQVGLSAKPTNVMVNVGKSGKNFSVSGKNFSDIVDVIVKPDFVSEILKGSTKYPTAYAEVSILNTGNREAKDIDLEVRPNGILVESNVNSSEPSVKLLEKIIDQQANLPIGLSIPRISRLAPEGFIKLKVYWTVIDTDSAGKDALPAITVNGTYNGGTIKYIESFSQSTPNYVLLTSIFISLLALGIFMGWMFARSYKK